MKPRLLLTFASVVALLAAVPGSSLLHAASKTDSSAPTATFIETNTIETSEIRAIAERATNILGVALINEAAAATKAATASEALAICHLQPAPASGPIVPSLPRVTAYKRTSLRLRDPANAPDEAETLALQRMHTIIEAGDLPPKLLLQKLEFADGHLEWRVYRNVVILPACLKCHGSFDDIPEDLRADYQRRFPNDQASGYGTGEWRGLMRVTIADAPAKPGK